MRNMADISKFFITIFIAGLYGRGRRVIGHTGVPEAKLFSFLKLNISRKCPIRSLTGHL